MNADPTTQIPQSQRDRLKHIELRLRFLGEVRRADLMARFGIQSAAASRDLALYKELAPFNAEFDQRSKLGPISRAISAEAAARQVGSPPTLADADHQQQLLFLGPVGGSMKLHVGDQPVQVISSEAPLGKALLGKGEGDEVSIQIAAHRQQFEVQRVH